MRRKSRQVMEEELWSKVGDPLMNIENAEGEKPKRRVVSVRKGIGKLINFGSKDQKKNRKNSSAVKIGEMDEGNDPDEVLAGLLQLEQDDHACES